MQRVRAQPGNTLSAHNRCAIADASLLALFCVRVSLPLCSAAALGSLPPPHTFLSLPVPPAVTGFKNLFAMEIDPTIEVESGDVLDAGSAGVIAELASSIPGIDEGQ